MAPRPLSLVEEALALAERDWRQIVRATYPLNAAIEVVTRKAPGSEAPLEAYTDYHSIHIRLNDPAQLDRLFRGVVGPHHSADADAIYGVRGPVSDREFAKALAYDALLFLLFHELYHPLVCPNSKDDEQAISVAIFEGLTEWDPNLAVKDRVYLVNNCKNLIWDVVVNVTFLARCRGVRRDVLAGRIADAFRKRGRVLAGESVDQYPSEAAAALYLLFARIGATDVLIDLVTMFYVTLSQTSAALRDRSIKALAASLAAKGLVTNDVLDHVLAMYEGLVADMDPGLLRRIGIDPDEFERRALITTQLSHPAYGENQRWLLRAIDRIFDSGLTRYVALKGLARVLAPFVSPTEKGGSPDSGTCSEGAGPSESSGDTGGENAPNGAEDAHQKESLGSRPEEATARSIGQTIEDLATTLGDEGVEELLNDIGENPEPAGAGTPMPRRLAQALQVAARDALYKRAAEELEVVAPTAGFEQVDLGREQRWKLRRTQDLTAAEVTRVDLPKLAQVQIATGLPFLLQLADGRFKLNEFEVVESPLTGWIPQRYEVHVPDNWVLLIDTSGSMSGKPLDLLWRVIYSVMRAVHAVCRDKNRDVRFGVVNFSDRTLASRVDSFVKVYASRTHQAKQLLFQDQAGGTRLDIAVLEEVEKQLRPGKTVYTLVTDGEISNDGAVKTTVERLAGQPDTSFLYVEIGSQSSMGRQLDELSESLPTIQYRRVADIGEIAEALQTLLLRYA